MSEEGGRRGPVGLEAHGLANVGRVHWNPSVPELYELSVCRGEGAIAEGGALVVSTGVHTGRAPKDKFVVREPGSEDRVWWGPVNKPLPLGAYERLGVRMGAYLQGREVFVIDAFAGAHPAHRVALRVVSESAWHAL